MSLHIENLSVESVDSFSEDIIQEMLQIERSAFGEGGLYNEWLLIPFIRFGKVFTAKIDNDIVGCAQFIREWKNPAVSVRSLGILA